MQIMIDTQKNFVEFLDLLDAVVPKQIRDFFDKNIEDIKTDQRKEKSVNTTTGLDTDENFFVGLLSGFKEHVKAIYPGITRLFIPYLPHLVHE